MQAFAFGLRQSSAAPSVDDNHSRYVPSSIYSGPGPAEEYPMPTQHQPVQNGAGQTSIYSSPETQYRKSPSNKTRPRTSAMLNMNDPVVMHLLMETAIIDSKDFEVLSFEELEHLKKERAFLRTKIEGAKRQLALESKMREAALSLNKLYTRDSDSSRRDSSGFDELAASNQKLEQLNKELKALEQRLETVNQRVLKHTAGILQLTHRGLKKNIRKNELPRSPESMASRSHRSLSRDGIDEFDERSLYQVPDYVHEFHQSSPNLNGASISNNDKKAVESVTKQLHELTNRLQTMLQSLDDSEHAEPPPIPAVNAASGNPLNQIQAQLGYMSRGLDALATSHERSNNQAQQEQLMGLTSKLNDILKRTDSVKQSPALSQRDTREEDTTMMLDRLNSRVDGLLQQKDILTRQIQQQRELNSKSDAQRDQLIQQLTDEMSEVKESHSLRDQELQQSTTQISQLMDELDRVKQDQVLLEQQREHKDNRALQELQEEHNKTQKEMQGMESQVIQLQTELTMVKAELDGAYGTRAERAADVSMNPAVRKEIDDLNARNSALQKELKETIEDYELMTKSSIESEKERDHLEATIDGMRDRCEALEAQVNEEKVKWLGIKNTIPPENTSTMVLKNEFKKMIKESRAESIKQLKAEQDERRRLEGVIRGMKRDQGLQTPSKPQAKFTNNTEPATPA